MNDGGSRVGKLVGIRIPCRGESRIGKYKLWRARAKGTRGFPPRISLKDGAHLRRRPSHTSPPVDQNVGLEGCRRDKGLLGGRLELAKTFVAKEKERIVLDDWTTDSKTILSQTKGGDGRVPVYVEIVEVARIEHGISEITKRRSVEVICPRLGDDIDLPTGLGAIFSVIECAIDAIFGDGILGDLQPNLRFLCLLLDAASVNAIEIEIIVVNGAAPVADGALIAPAIVLGERCEHGQCRPVTSVDG